MAESPTNIPSEVTGESLKQFQLAQATIKEKSSKEYGLAIMKYIASTTTFSYGSYYFQRNARFIKNRNYANGQLDIQAMFQDRFQFNGKPNYIFLNWNALQIVNRIVSGLVGRWMKRHEKIQVKAIDNLSQTQKQQEYEWLEFVIDQREKLEALQAESGVQILPQGDELPEDKEALNIWRSEMQRLPEEIQTEMGCNEVLSSNGWFDTLKEKMLHDAAEVLFVGTYTYMDNNGIIHVKWVKPENAIYSSTDYNDLRDTSWRGEAPEIKISELRRQYGKEFNPNNELALTEEQLWKIAQSAKDYKYQSNISWNPTWVTAFTRPYDEWNVRSVQVEVKTVDKDPYTVTKTKSTGTTYTEKGYPTTKSGKPRPPKENQNIIHDTNFNIYRGVYLPDCDILLEWGLKDNMITPQDPREVGNAEFSYSFVMPQNYLMRNLAIPEKIEAAVDGMILACLKMQQVVARMRPTGAAIDESALQNIDYGLGDEGNKNIDYKKLYDQTGDIYYRGVDAEGNRVPIPIQELQNSGFLAQMDGLIRNYQFWYQSLKDELGEDPSLISAAIQPRVTGENVQASQAESENATDYIYHAYTECMKQTARKISCLLKDSITYGAKAYRHIAKKEDVGKRIFATDVRFLPTEYEVQKFEAILNQAIASTPELIMFIDPFRLVRTAKEDVKLAELLFRHAQKKMLMWQRQTAIENQQQTIQGQIDAAKMAEEEKRKTKEAELVIEKEKSQITALAQNQTAVLNLMATLLKPSGEGGAGGQIPPELRPLVNATVENIMVGAIAQTEEQKQKIIQEIQAAREQQQQEQMMAEQNFEQPPQQQAMA
ncbi:MAG TPA: hypothetical protein PKV73_01135 [Agriterribacter sp.]|nr:hypothetical protein [Agriterribacter sp.]